MVYQSGSDCPSYPWRIGLEPVKMITMIDWHDGIRQSCWQGCVEDTEVQVAKLKTWQQKDFTTRDFFWKSFAPTCGISCPSLWMASFQTRFFAPEVGLMWRPCYHKNLFYAQNKSINTNRAYRRFLSKKQTRFFEDCSFRMWKKTGCASRCITHVDILI